jgi:hypothetical protein
MADAVTVDASGGGEHGRPVAGAPEGVPPAQRPPDLDGPSATADRTVDGSTLLVDQPFELGTLRRLRAAVACATDGAPPAPGRAFAIVAGELASNAVRHGRTAGCGCGAARAPPTARSPTTDRGSAIRSPPYRRGAVDPSSGRGLWIVRQLADDVNIACDGSGTVALATIALAGGTDPTRPIVGGWRSRRS